LWGLETNQSQDQKLNIRNSVPTLLQPLLVNLCWRQLGLVAGNFGFVCRSANFAAHAVGENGRGLGTVLSAGILLNFEIM
jgi:hypothetical protein